MNDEQKQQETASATPVESTPVTPAAAPVAEEKKQSITLADVKAGMTVRVHQRITDVTKDGKERERIQVYEGIVLVRHGGTTSGATVTIRKISNGIGVEKIFPVRLPSIEKVEIVKQVRLHRARAFFLRDPKKVKRMKEIAVRA